MRRHALARASTIAATRVRVVLALAVLLIAAALFPVFKRQGEGAALGYVGFRLLVAVTLAAAAIIPVTLVSLGRASTGADAAAPSSFEVLGDQLLRMRAGLLGILVPLFFCLGAVLLYNWLLRSKLLPRFIPISGLVGVAGIAALNLLNVGTTVAMILALPIILNEVFLGVWLMVKGFDGVAATPRAAAPAA